MKLRKSNLDEQQERKLLEIESRGCWLAFWGLLVALIVETVVMTKDLRAIIGEWVLFMGLALYLAISCMRAGIWDRRADMSRRTRLLFSLAAGICAGLFLFAFTFTRYQRLIGSLCTGVIGVVLPLLSPISFCASRHGLRKNARTNSTPSRRTRILCNLSHGETYFRATKKAAFTIF